MKTFSLITAIFIGLLLSFTSPVTAQWKQYKFGKIDKSELEMKQYPNDTSANALVLFHDGYTSYHIISNDFKVVTEVSKRIKILKTEGTEYATIQVRLNCNRSGCEVIDKVEAYSYNLENGKVEKSKLDKKYIFEEKASDYIKIVKFAIPNAKAGSVIEYRFNVTSSFYYDLPNWNFQSEIPVQYARYEVLIPEYFQFNIESKGYEQINVKEVPENQVFNIRSSGSTTNQPLTCSARKIIYSMEHVPAMRDENFVWNVRDFMSGLRFELLGTRFPGDFYKPYTQNWDNVDKIIRENTDFNSYISRNNPFKKEIAALISTIVEEKEKIEAIYQFVKEKISWNESYALISNPSEAVKNGKGNNAQINAVMLSAFKDAGFKACPVLLSRRSQGRLPLTYPSIDQLNTYVVMVTDSKGKNYFMDGSAQYGGLNMLPTDLLVDRARVYSTEIAEKWIDLTGIGKNNTLNLITAEMKSDGTISGTYTSVYNDQPALNMKTKLGNLKDTAEYRQELENNLKIDIESISYEGEKSLISNQMKREIKFVKKNEDQGSFIYLNPLIFSHIDKNNFVQSERKLPVEFSYPYSYRITSSIRIPENYRVEEMPKSGKMTLNNNNGVLNYIIQHNNGLIEVSYRLDLNQTIFPFSEYETLQRFFTEVVTKNNALIVLKKI
jgi:transglutaminase-like putative cysteine protease